MNSWAKFWPGYWVIEGVGYENPRYLKNGIDALFRQSFEMDPLVGSVKELCEQVVEAILSAYLLGYAKGLGEEDWVGQTGWLEIAWGRLSEEDMEGLRECSEVVRKWL